MARALSDRTTPDHPDVARRLPADLPSATELRLALGILEGEARTSERHAGRCMAKLVMAFEPNTRLTADETRLRLAVWLEANGDLGDALWSMATIAAIQGSSWMPKPAEFRKLVQPELAERERRRQRCRALLQAHGLAAGNSAQGFVREPEAVRLRGSRDSFQRLGNVARAAHYERRLAALETRAPEKWALEAERRAS